MWRASTGGFFVIDEVLGWRGSTKYAVGIGPGGALRRVEIRKYSESYDDDVHYADWWQQFAGKIASSPLRLGEDIKYARGATLTSKHLTEDVKRVFILYEIALKERP